MSSRSLLPITLVLVLAACAPLVPQAGARDLATQVAQTVSAMITKRPPASATPAATRTPTPSPVPTASPTDDMRTAEAYLQGATLTASCYDMNFVKDVTIPDWTVLPPKAPFRKTWRVLNSGSCAWQPHFRLFYANGAMLTDSTPLLGRVVQPGQTVDLSVDMQSPSREGDYESYWHFGGSIYGFGDALSVRIEVQNPTPTPTASVTPSPTISPTPTLSPSPTSTPTASPTSAPTSTPTPTDTPEPPTDTPTP